MPICLSTYLSLSIFADNRRGQVPQGKKIPTFQYPKRVSPVVIQVVNCDSGTLYLSHRGTFDFIYLGGDKPSRTLPIIQRFPSTPKKYHRHSPINNTKKGPSTPKQLAIAPDPVIDSTCGKDQTQLAIEN